MSQWVHKQTNKLNSLLFLRENSEQLRFGWNRGRVSPARLPGRSEHPSLRDLGLCGNRRGLEVRAGGRDHLTLAGVEPGAGS